MEKEFARVLRPQVSFLYIAEAQPWVHNEILSAIPRSVHFYMSRSSRGRFFLRVQVDAKGYIDTVKTSKGLPGNGAARPAAEGIRAQVLRKNAGHMVPTFVNNSTYKLQECDGE